MGSRLEPEVCQDSRKRAGCKDALGHFLTDWGCPLPLCASVGGWAGEFRADGRPGAMRITLFSPTLELGGAFAGVADF